MTHRKELARQGWHRSLPIRAISVLIGAGLLLAGVVLRSLETEYGGNADRKEYVVAREAGRPVQVLNETGVVFEGTQQEVDEWLADQRRARNYTVAVLCFAGGAALFFIGVAPRRRQDETPGSDFQLV